MNPLVPTGRSTKRRLRLGLWVCCGLVCLALRPASEALDPDPPRVVELRSAGIDLTYDVTEIRAVAGEALTIRYINASETLEHNVVVLRNEDDIRPVGIAALRAHATAHVPLDLADRIVAYTDLAQPGDTVTVTFTVPPPGVYPYICTYSGHFTMMQGRLISTAPDSP